METNNDFKDILLNLTFRKGVNPELGKAISELGKILPEVGSAIPVATGPSAFAEPSPLIEQVYAIGSLISKES